MPVVDNGAPTGGRGIEALTKPKETTDATDLINEVEASKVNRTTTRNSIYESDLFHIDSIPITGQRGATRCKVEVQRKKGTKNTVAVAILQMHVSSDADVRQALLNSLGNQHVWEVS